MRSYQMRSLFLRNFCLTEFLYFFSPVESEPGGRFIGGRMGAVWSFTIIMTPSTINTMIAPQIIRKMMSMVLLAQFEVGREF